MQGFGVCVGRLPTSPHCFAVYHARLSAFNISASGKADLRIIIHRFLVVLARQRRPDISVIKNLFFSSIRTRIAGDIPECSQGLHEEALHHIQLNSAFL